MRSLPVFVSVTTVLRASRSSSIRIGLTVYSLASAGSAASAHATATSARNVFLEARRSVLAATGAIRRLGFARKLSSSGKDRHGQRVGIVADIGVLVIGGDDLPVERDLGAWHVDAADRVGHVLGLREVLEPVGTGTAVVRSGDGECRVGVARALVVHCDAESRRRAERQIDHAE